jgi:hypothetical protein
MYNPYCAPMYPQSAPMNPYGYGPIANARMQMDMQQMQTAQLQMMQDQAQYWQQQGMMQNPMFNALGMRY